MNQPTTRQVEDDVKDGDVVTDGKGNEFVVVKRTGHVQGSWADQQARIKTMRRLATFFKVLAFAFVFGVVLQIVFGIFANLAGTVFYTLMSIAMSVVLEFLANLGERVERITRYLAKQENRATVNELLKD